MYFNPDPGRYVLMCHSFRAGDQIHGLLMVLAHQSKSASISDQFV